MIYSLKKINNKISFLESFKQSEKKRKIKQCLFVIILISIAFFTLNNRFKVLERECKDLKCINEILDNNLNVIVYYREDTRKPNNAKMNQTEFLVKKTNLLSKLRIPLVTVDCE
jgi:hypothetical protein